MFPFDAEEEEVIIVPELFAEGEVAVQFRVVVREELLEVVIHPHVAQREPCTQADHGQDDERDPGVAPGEEAFETFGAVVHQQEVVDRAAQRWSSPEHRAATFVPWNGE